MKHVIEIALTTCLLAMSASACGGKQSPKPTLDTRPLEEGKANEIIEEVLAGRGYSFVKGATVRAARITGFPCDYRVDGESIAIEFLTEKDRRVIGPIPAPAKGSRLHVLSGTTTSAGGTAQIYVFFIDDRDFIYQVNPTSETRADVTFLEVDSRLRRDLADFLSWYEEAKGKR